MKTKTQRLVVVGNGMAGMACLEQILRHGKDWDVTVFGEETYVNYNRIMLSSVLAGEKQMDEIVLHPLTWYSENQVQLQLGTRIVDIDPVKKLVRDEDGGVTEYDKLLLATGSSPFVPPIPGVNLANVYAFRNIQDTKKLLERAGPGVKAVVIGGGLLGLEAARGLQVQGCSVTVVHLMPTLMDRQLDETGGRYLKESMEALGVTMKLGKQTREILGEGKVERLVFSDGEEIEVDLLVIAAGIRPNIELGRKAGLEVQRGILVNDYLETSDPDVFAVGECVEHRGVVYGLVAPLYEQGRVLASTINGLRESTYAGSATGTKLKIMGVDVFSAGLIDERNGGCEAIRYEDPAQGIYKKLVLKDGCLAGVILVGDVSDSARYMEWYRTGVDLSSQRRHLLFPEPAADAGENIAMMPDSETVCGCLGVSKGTIIEAIHEKGVCTMSQLKAVTRASTGCGSCGGKCQELLRAVAPNYEEDEKKSLCGCVPFTDDRLREIIHTQHLKSVQAVLDIYGNGTGCEICRPALSYLVDQVWCGEHEEDRSSRFINDRVHANIQRDGTFSVIPRMRGGVTTPAELRRIADVADKYEVPMVKVTGSQRIDLLGVKKADLPKIWEELGMPSGQAYAKGLRMVKTCVGTQFCRFGTQDAISTGVELETRFENLYTPHKTKLAVVGCPRNCAEATVKDIGLIGQEGSWQVVVGGAAGKSVREADLLITVSTTEEALVAAELFFQYYRENANYLERSYDFVERSGIEKIRRATVYAPDEQKLALRERLAKSKNQASDPWLERNSPRPTQFVQIAPMEVPVDVAVRS